ncbi:Crp/Fnr family transcriptional regulator [Flavobacterium beibuense]|uniref:Putative transcriptional regulator, Crp/Fnr family n=1 Tax=Flavobacterium beibuense TaxID=657326 RepID=A0A444WA90_9FLAO|nr:Crp/Fnr family transcriptional regulator [Flavobacterium beibuense]RYJ42807.1 putative transcriptional regulator, Crp/Fnr family [Flavobacterium beibuense]
MKSLHAYLNRYVSALISEKDFEMIAGHFTPMELKKKQYLLKEGQVIDFFAFIVKGAMRKYYIDDKGKEHVINLYIENWWAGDRESFALLTPSRYYIETCEPCEILVITRENKEKLCRECPVFNEFILKLDEKYSVASQKRIASSISSSARERYDDFAARYPEFLQRFPQHLIASYLGITKDTLSRVLKQ